MICLSCANDSWLWVQREGSTYVRYKSGVRVFFLPTSLPAPYEERERGLILDQSRASRHNAAFNFGNAECTWLAMLTLTWRFAPTSREVKLVLRRFRKAWRERWGESMDAWMMEMQKRGVPHFHVFIARESLVGERILQMPTEPKRRKGRVRSIVRGSVENWIIQTWLDCIEDRSLETIAFQRGGILELFQSENAAGRYVAKESCKRVQKLLPEEYAEGLGRWWWLNPLWKPVERERGDVVDWPHEMPMRYVWEEKNLRGHLRPQAPVCQTQAPVCQTSEAKKTYTLRPRPRPMATMGDLGRAAGIDMRQRPRVVLRMGGRWIKPVHGHEANDQADDTRDGIRQETF